MEQTTMGIEAFLGDIHPGFEEMVKGIHALLTQEGCAVRLQEAKSGHVVSYTHPAGKKVVANFVSRKTGPMVRIYADNLEAYGERVQALPEALRKKIAKAPACKRLLDPAKCNARCPMGYQFELEGEKQKKCRYNAFLLPLTEESCQPLRELLEQELFHRAAR